MKKIYRRLYAPALLGLLLVIGLLGVAFANSILSTSNENIGHVKSLIKEPTQSVYTEIQKDVDELETSVIRLPYADENVKMSISYYSKDAENAEQEASIIKYENTYLPSTGIMYSSDEEFDVTSVYDGTVTDIYDDNLLGKVIAIKHSDKLVGYYYSLKDVKLNIGDSVSAGQAIGVATENKISSQKYNLLFEVAFEDKLINPSEIYDKNIGNFS